MRKPPIALLLILLIPSFAFAQDSGFKAIFDGKSLAGWDGNPDLWRVEDGAIVGETTPEKKLSSNSFLSWELGEVDDFILELDYKIDSGNSGIQVRSFRLPGDEKWRLGGYQADIDADNKFCGIIYGEQYRGILAKRGEKTEIGNDHKPVLSEKFAEHETHTDHIKIGDWNTYKIVAKGNSITNFINGTLTSQTTDADEVSRRRSGLLAFQLHVGPPMKVSFRDIRLKRLKLEDSKKIVFVAGKKSHGWGSHEHNAGCLLLSKSLNTNPAAKILSTVYQSGWPADPTAFDNADAIVMYCDGGGRHFANFHLRQIDGLASSGVGIGCIHYGVEVPKGESGNHFKRWIGGYFEPHWSVNPHWDAEFEKFPEHPVTRGVKPFSVRDEWYYHMRFRDGMEGVTPILTDLPPAETLNRRDGAHSGNPAVRKAIASGEAQHVMWVSERPSANRGFGFTGGHFHDNWGNDNFRKIVLNAIAWIAHAEVPSSGIESPTPDRLALDANQDEPKPENKR